LTTYKKKYAKVVKMNSMVRKANMREGHGKEHESGMQAWGFGAGARAPPHMQFFACT
jgi:hypothetical protein